MYIYTYIHYPGTHQVCEWRGDNNQFQIYTRQNVEKHWKFVCALCQVCVSTKKGHTSSYTTIWNTHWVHGRRRSLDTLILHDILRKQDTEYWTAGHSSQAAKNDLQDIWSWRRIGSLMLQVSFHSSATNCRACLWEETCKDKISYVASPPCKGNGTMSQRCRCATLTVHCQL